MEVWELKLYFYPSAGVIIINSGLDSLGLVSLTSEALLSAMTWLRSCPQNAITKFLSRFVRLME